jgi:hypothetical protein
MSEELEQYLLKSKAKRDKLKKIAEKFESRSKKHNLETFPNITPKRFKKYEESVSRNLIQIFIGDPKKKYRSASQPKKRGLASIYNIPKQTASKTLKLPPMKRNYFKDNPSQPTENPSLPSHNTSNETSPSLNFSLPSKPFKLHYFNPSLLTPVLKQKYLN